MTPPSDAQSTQSIQSILKWVAIGCGSGLVVAIGVVAGVFILIRQSLNVSFDANAAEQAAEQIMDFEIPGGANGFFSTRFGGIEMAGVVSATDPDAVVLFLARVSPATAAERDPAQLKESLQQGMEQQLGSAYSLSARRTEARSLCGQTVNVDILEGQHNPDSSGQADSSGSLVPALTYQTLLEYNKALLFVSLTTTGEQAQDVAERVFGSLTCQD